MSRKRIILHGYLKGLWSGPAEFEAETAAEAIYAFTRQTKAFNIKPGQSRHCVRVVGFDDVSLLFHPTDVEEIHLVPDFSGGGGGGGGFFKIGIGILLIAAAMFIPGLQGLVLLEAGALGAGSAAITGATVAFSMGLSLVLGGLMEIMSPAPKREVGNISAEAQAAASRYLGAPKNTTRIGTRIGILYGRGQVYGHFLSFDINAKQVPV